jgi:carboxymethylenebutenolidase
MSEPMGEMVEFPSNGHEAGGYLAVSATGSGPGIIVIQEWWGLVDHITDLCDRFAAEGFTALAPDLYHGTKVANTEPDEAGKLLMTLNLDQAAKDMSGAVDFLRDHPGEIGAVVGVVGFCMGGGLALMLATQRPDAIGACVPFYGIIPWENANPDWSKLSAPVLGHFAENDGMFTPEKARELEAQLHALGKDADFIIHPGVDHAFFNDTRPEVYDAETAASAWYQTMAFLRSELG